MKIFPLAQRYAIWASLFTFGFSLVRAEADANAEKALREFFASMVSRDVAGLSRVLGDKVAVIEAGRLRAHVGFSETTNARALLPPAGKESADIEVTSVKVDVSSTHPSVAMASFTFDFRFSKQQLANAEAELKEGPANPGLQKLIVDGGLKASMFAMLARNHDGTWKVVCLSLPS